jgi:hypothetical protein
MDIGGICGSGIARMSDEEDEASARQLREEAFVARYVKGLLEPAGRDYRQILTSLWLGNGTASLAVLSFIGATWQDGKFPPQLMWPLTCFVLGLISMGVGTGIFLWTEGRKVRAVERATSFRELPSGQAQSPSERAGLTLRNVRTKAALLSAALFVLGCIIGLSELWSAN